MPRSDSSAVASPTHGPPIAKGILSRFAFGYSPLDIPSKHSLYPFRRLCAIALAGAVNLLDTSRSSMNKPSGQPRVCHLRSLFPASLSFSLTQSHIQSVSRCDLATFQSPAVNVCVIIPAICCSANCSCIPTIRYCLCAFPLALSRLHLLFTPRCISLTLSHSHSLFCVPIFTAFWRFLLSMEKEFCCSTSTLLVKYCFLHTCTYL